MSFHSHIFNKNFSFFLYLRQNQWYIFSTKNPDISRLIQKSTTNACAIQQAMVGSRLAAYSRISINIQIAVYGPLSTYWATRWVCRIQKKKKTHMYDCGRCLTVCGMWKKRRVLRVRVVKIFSRFLVSLDYLKASSKAPKIMNQSIWAQCL